MGPFVLAWLVGEGIIVYRTWRTYKAPPGPGQLAFSSGLFILLALLAESRQARALAILLAWGFDIAAFMNLVGTGPKEKKANFQKWPPDKLPDNVTWPG